MSWLNFNDSLNNLKGQISSFANNVLADENKDSGDLQSNFEELQRICSKQQEEINKLRRINEELHAGGGEILSTFLNNDNSAGQEASWSWEVPNTSKVDKNAPDKIIHDLKETITKLENEKQDLVANLELLDSDHQSNTEKLISLKDRLQADYNNLEDKYTLLQDNNRKLLNSREKCTKCESLSVENGNLVSELEALKNEIALLNSSSNSFSVAEETKEIREKLKLCEAENKILITELQKASQSVAAFERKSVLDAENCRKLAEILEGYEQQVSCLKQELSTAKNNEQEDQLQRDLELVRNQLKATVAEKDQTHKKYVSILTENVKKYVDNGTSSDPFNNYAQETDPQIAEFSHQVESILNILLDLKCKCENLEKDLCTVTQEKTNLLSEKNHEIEKLLQNSEILSQEVITKSQTIKDYESECSELIKNNDILINELEAYKDSSGLQTISESNEDNVLYLESQLESANKKIEELEGHIFQLENNAATTQESTEVASNPHLENVLAEKETLNQSLEKMKVDLENTEYQYTELHINMESLKEEVENQKRKIAELLEQNVALEKSNQEYERTNENVRSEFNAAREKLLFEEDTRKQLENQLRNLTEKLQNAKMCETSLKLQYDTVNKELVSVTEAKWTLESTLKNTLEHLTLCQNNLATLQEENEVLKNTIANLELAAGENQLSLNEAVSSTDSVITQFQSVNLNENDVDKLRNENTKLVTDLDGLRQQFDAISEEKRNVQIELDELRSIKNQHVECGLVLTSLQQQIEELDKTKNELTNVIITKHQENITYHNEIQRLSQILNAESEKAHNLELLLEVTRSPVDEAEFEKKNQEVDKLTDQNYFLKQKCEILAENLLQEQNKAQQVLASASEKEQTLSKKLDRLQTHLIEVEEHYTQELLRAEERNTELQAKVNEIEQREKNSSTMYTSVSIRANQHVETLQHQLQLITNQRDELRRRISDAEDHTSKQEAALANLQFVLEQFQKDKEKDVQQETERIRRQISAEKRVQEELRGEMASLQAQLEESKQGLQAASRLSDQLEHSKQAVVALKSEVSQLKEKLCKSEEQLQNVSSQHDGKVDKSLIKNLIIGFVSTNNNLNKDQAQIMKIIATVLDFNQQDHDKIGLNKPQQGWLSSFLTPHTSQGMSQESLSQAFVKFLENESKPRLVPSLLSNNNESSKSRKNSVTTATRQSPSILSEVVLPTFADFAQNRNSSSILKDVLKDNS